MAASTTSGYYEFVVVHFRTSFCSSNISVPNIAQKWFCIQNFHVDLSFQKKKRFRNLFLGSRDIKQILFLRGFFLETPVLE